MKEIETVLAEASNKSDTKSNKMQTRSNDINESERILTEASKKCNSKLSREEKSKIKLLLKQLGGSKENLYCEISNKMNAENF